MTYLLKPREVNSFICCHQCWAQQGRLHEGGDVSAMVPFAVTRPEETH